MEPLSRTELLKLPAEELVNRLIEAEFRAAISENKATLLNAQVSDLRRNVEDLRATVTDLRKITNQAGQSQKQREYSPIPDAASIPPPFTMSAPVATVAPMPAVSTDTIQQQPLQPQQNEVQSDASKLIPDLNTYIDQYRQWVSYFAAFPPVAAKTDASVRSVTPLTNPSTGVPKQQQARDIVTDRCTDPEVLARRSKQIEQTKEKQVYQRYTAEVPKGQRQRGQPRTPDKTLNFSRRSWDSQIKRWKLKLHAWEDEKFSNQLLNTASTAHHNGTVEDNALTAFIGKINLNNTV